MQPRIPRLVLHGALGGLAAGLVVAVWFFVLDLLSGQPLQTPMTLASGLLDRTVDVATPTLILGYSILHFGVFLVIGIAAALGLAALNTAPGLRHGIIFGVIVFTAVHYGALLVTGVEMMTLLPEVHVVLANFVGGVVMMAVLHYTEHAESPLGLGALREHPVIAQGVVAGLVGGVTVAAWFLVLDVVSGRPFFTPAALGSTFFLGVTAASNVQVNIGMIAAYTVLHFGAFIVVGTALVWVTERVEQKPGLWLVAVMAFIVLEAGFLGTVGAVGGWVLGAVGWWAVLVGNLLAITAMGRLVWKTHPELSRRLTEDPVPTMV